jgi:hypothetical protein
MSLVRRSLPVVRPIVWAIIAVSLIMVGLPAVLAAAT